MLLKLKRLFSTHQVTKEKQLCNGLYFKKKSIWS